MSVKAFFSLDAILPPSQMCSDNLNKLANNILHLERQNKCKMSEATNKNASILRYFLI